MPLFDLFVFFVLCFLFQIPRPFQAEEAAARQRESTLRSYGLMAMPGI
jgi:hypothetical protein